MTATKSRDREELLLNLVNALADRPRASMEQLASMVGLSRATLCRHFPSRDSMVLAMSEAGISSAKLAIARARPDEGSPEHAIKRLIEELLPIVELYAYVDQQGQADEEMDARVQPLRASLIALFQQWQGSGELRVDLPAAWLVESMSALLRSAATMIRSGRLARRDAAQSVFDLLWRGMAK
jgi:AcrR family transcriptional regulator